MAEKEDITKTKSFTFWTLKKIKYVDCQSVIVGKVTGQIRFFEHLHLLGAHGLHRTGLLSRVSGNGVILICSQHGAD